MDETDLWDDLSCQLDTTLQQPISPSVVDGLCQHRSLSFHNGKQVCEECGGILDDEEVIDQTAEWRNFNQGSKATARCSDARSPFVPDSLSINTFIRDGDRRLQRVHQFSHTSARERLFAGIHKEFEDITLKYELPRVIYKTMCELYFKVFMAMQERNYAFQRCNIRKGLIAACLFYACKLNGNPRNYKEIAEMLGYERKWVTKGCNNFTDVLGEEFINLPPFKPSDFVERFCTCLALDFASIGKITELVQWVEGKRIVHESTPSSVAAAIIYHYVNRDNANVLPIEKVSKACEVSKTVILKLNEKLSESPSFLTFVNEQKTNTHLTDK